MSRSHQFFPVTSTTKQKAANPSFLAAVNAEIKKIEDLRNSYANLEKQLAAFKNKTGNNNPNTDTSIPSAMNPLGYEINDAIAMITCVPLANQNTMKILLSMHEIAVDAANGNHTNAELKDLDLKYQALKNYIAYAQMINLIAGPKALGSGSITVQFGDGHSVRDQLKIPLGAIDIKSLDIDKTDVLSATDALTALGAISIAYEDVVENIVSSMVRVDDAANLIKSVAYILNNVMELYGSVHNLAIEAATGTASNADRFFLNIIFDSVKAELDKAQTIITDDGVKCLGTGAMTIRLGDTTNDLTTLVIPLPVTDIVKSGLDKHNLLTAEDAIATLRTVNKLFHDTVYGQNHHEKLNKYAETDSEEEVLSVNSQDSEEVESSEDFDDDRSISKFRR